MTIALNLTPRPTRFYYRLWEWLMYIIGVAVLASSAVLLYHYLHTTVSVENNWDVDQPGVNGIMFGISFAAVLVGIIVAAIFETNRFEFRMIWMASAAILLWIFLSVFSSSPVAPATVPDGMVRVTADGNVHTSATTLAQPLQRGLFAPQSTRLRTSLSFWNEFTVTASLTDNGETIPVTRRHKLGYHVETDPTSLETWTTSYLAQGHSFRDLTRAYNGVIQAIHKKVQKKVELTPQAVSPTDILHYTGPFMVTVHIEEVFVSRALVEEVAVTP